MNLASADLSRVPDWQAICFFMSIILWWATMRPSMIRDYENRRLPVNATARLLFVLVSLLVYAALVVAFHSFSDVAIKVSASIPVANHIVDSFKDHAPFLAAVTIGGMLQLSFFRDIERHTLVWLHSARHLHNDVQELTGHLQRNPFVPSEDEKAKNREAVRRYGVFVLDEAGGPKTGPVTLASWRKVSTLLRMLREWNGEGRSVLNQNEINTLGEIEALHERKTQLALTIVRMIEQASQGGAATETLSELLVMLADTSHFDRSRVVEVEARARLLLSGQVAPAMERPLRLTSEELRRHVAQIEGYFRIEYDFLMEQAALLTAKSVILSNERAPERFQQLKVIGFTGLGRIEPINFDRILWLFVVVAFGSFLVLFIGNLGSANAPLAWDRIARFSLVMATAALIGANFGSSRRYQRRRSTPWGVYFTAGLAAAAVHVGMTATWDLVRTFVSDSQIHGASTPPLVKSLPWAFLPALMTVAICRLARIEHYPFLPQTNVWRSLAERSLDGVCTSGAVLIAYYLGIAIFQAMDWALPPMIEQKMLAPHVLPIPILPHLQFVGFLIGFFTVADVRRAARARMIDPVASSPARTGETDPSTHNALALDPS